MLTCEQARELEATFAAGALDEDEFEAMQTHLMGCDRHPAVSEYRAALLAGEFVTEPVQPSAELRERVLTLPDSRRRPQVRKPIALWMTAAAALLLVAMIGVALAGWPGNDDEVLERAFTTETGVDVTVLARMDEAETELSFDNLEPLTAGTTYTAWAIRDGAWLSIGQFRPNDNGWWQGEFTFRMQRGDSLCVTVGAQGDPYSHGDPLFIEPL